MLYQQIACRTPSRPEVKYFTMKVDCYFLEIIIKYNSFTFKLQIFLKAGLHIKWWSSAGLFWSNSHCSNRKMSLGLLQIWNSDYNTCIWLKRTQQKSESNLFYENCLFIVWSALVLLTCSSPSDWSRREQNNTGKTDKKQQNKQIQYMP